MIIVKWKGRCPLQSGLGRLIKVNFSNRENFSHAGEASCSRISPASGPQKLGQIPFLQYVHSWTDSKSDQQDPPAALAVTHVPLVVRNAKIPQSDQRVVST